MKCLSLHPTFLSSPALILLFLIFLLGSMIVLLRGNVNSLYIPIFKRLSYYAAVLINGKNSFAKFFNGKQPNALLCP
jgi:hypothetical protein